jgi:transketolase
MDPRRQIAAKMRQRIFEIISRAGCSHIGSAFSLVEVFTVLYHTLFDISKIKQGAQDRDYCLLSKGHACTVLYAALESVGLLDSEVFQTYGEDGTMLAGHPVRMPSCGIEASTGSLGHGLSIAVGLAFGLAQQKSSSRVITIVGDGEMQEGSNWEALQAADRFGLSNLTLIVDNNKLQGLDRPDDLGNNDLKSKLTSFGAEVSVVDGHNLDNLTSALLKPSSRSFKAIIAETVKGKGVSFMEDALEWHYKSPRDEWYEIAKRELFEQ